MFEPEEVTPVEELDGDASKVVVFDDIKIDSRHMEPIKEYFSLSRNHNCNCIYLTQSYYDAPKYIHRNTKAFCLFHGLHNRHIRHIADDHSSSISREEFTDVYRKPTCEPYTFMFLDKTSKHVPEMYRCGFDVISTRAIAYCRYSNYYCRYITFNVDLCIVWHSYK